MRLLAILPFSSLFAVSGVAWAEDGNASGAHPVAQEQHDSEASEPEPAKRAGSRRTTDDTPALRTRWYGWQSLSADGAALLTLISAGAASDQKGHLSDVLTYGSVGIYLLGAPVIHFAHGNPGRGLGSLGLRAGVPVAFGAIGSKLEDCSGDNYYDLCGIVGIIVGGVLGIATAITIDAAVLSYDEVPVASEGIHDVGVSIGPTHAQLVASGMF